VIESVQREIGLFNVDLLKELANNNQPRELIREINNANKYKEKEDEQTKAYKIIARVVMEKENQTTKEEIRKERQRQKQAEVRRQQEAELRRQEELQKQAELRRKKLQEQAELRRQEQQKQEQLRRQKLQEQEQLRQQQQAELRQQQQWQQNQQLHIQPNWSHPQNLQLPQAPHHQQFQPYNQQLAAFYTFNLSDQHLLAQAFLNHNNSEPHMTHEIYRRCEFNYQNFNYGYGVGRSKALLLVNWVRLTSPADRIAIIQGFMQQQGYFVQQPYAMYPYNNFHNGNYPPNQGPNPPKGVCRKRKLSSRENGAKKRKVDLLKRKIQQYEEKIQQLDDILDHNNQEQRD